MLHTTDLFLVVNFVRNNRFPDIFRLVSGSFGFLFHGAFCAADRFFHFNFVCRNLIFELAGFCSFVFGCFIFLCSHFQITIPFTLSVIISYNGPKENSCFVLYFNRICK